MKNLGYIKSKPSYKGLIIFMLIIAGIVTVFSSLLFTNYQDNQGLFPLKNIVIGLIIFLVSILLYGYLSRYIISIDTKNQIIKIKKIIGKKYIYSYEDINSVNATYKNNRQSGFLLIFNDGKEFLVDDLITSNFKDFEVELKKF